MGATLAPGKPGMKGHDPRLRKTEGEEKQKDDLGGRAEGCDLPVVAHEVHRDLSSLQPDVTPAQSGQEQAQGCEEQIPQVGSAPRAGAFVLHVSDQGKGRDGEHLVKEIDGQQVS